MSETTTPPAEPPRAAVRIGRVIPKGEFATLATDPYAWTWGGRIEPRDSVLVARGGVRALAHYKALKRDGRVSAVLGKRKAAVVGREWELKPADESEAAADASARVAEALKPLNLSTAAGALLEALLLGFLPGEIMWERAGNLVVPAEIRDRDPERFRFRDAGDGTGPQLRMLTKGQMVDGVEVPARKFVVHRHGGDYGDPYGLGLGHQLFWPCYFKRQGVGFWLGGLEKFGQPTIVGKYPNGTQDDAQQKLLDAIRAVSSDTGVTIPDGMVMELLEAKRAGTFDSYATLVRYFDEEIAVGVLGETLTTSQGERGSQSLGKVHNEVRLELTKADADGLAETLNKTLIPWTAEFNAIPAELTPKLWWKVEEAEDLNQRAERDTKIKGLGFRPTLDYVTETYGEGWEEAQPPTPPPGQVPPQPGAMPAGLAAAFAEAQGQPVPPEVALAAQLDRVAAVHTDQWLDQIRRLVEGAASFGEVADGLLTLYPQLATGGLAEAMQQALTVANLTGRAELADGLER